MPVFFVAQFIALFFRAHAAAEAGKVFVVFVFDRPFPASTRKDIASDVGCPVAAAGR